MLKEFPFLEDILEVMKRFSHKSIESIRVQRVDENLLKRILIDCYHDGSLGVSRTLEGLWAVLPEGRPQEVEVQHNYSWSSNYAHSQSKSEKGEPTIEAMIGFEKAEFLVLTKLEKVDWPGQQYVDIFEVVIFKPARSTSIEGEIEKARRRAVAKVKVEADF